MNSLTIIIYMAMQGAGVPLSLVVGLLLIAAIVWLARVIVLAIVIREQ